MELATLLKTKWINLVEIWLYRYNVEYTGVLREGVKSSHKSSFLFYRCGNKDNIITSNETPAMLFAIIISDEYKYNSDCRYYRRSLL